ncbi:MAG: hypothetical protein AAGE52_01230 [Myxococcota bacterium]
MAQTIELQALQRVAVTEESALQYATDLTGSATFRDVPFQEGTAAVALNEEILETQEAQQFIDAYPRTVRGPRSAELSFSMVLAPTGSPAGDGVASPTFDSNAAMLMLKAFFGATDDANAGTTFQAVTDAANWTLTSAAGFPNAGALGWVDSAGAYHMRELVTSSAPKVALPSTPLVSDVAYASTSIYLASNPPTTIQMIVEGANSEDRWVLMGGQVTAAPTLTIPIGDLPTISFTITFADWEKLGAAAITPATYDLFRPVYTQGHFVAQVGGTTTFQELDIASAAYTLNSPVFQAVTSPRGTPSGRSTVRCFRRIRAVPAAAVAISLPYEDDRWFTERDDREYYHLGYQIGNAPGETILITVPKAQVVNVQRVDETGLAYQSVEFRSTIDSFVTGTQTDQRRSAMRFHFG